MSDIDKFERAVRVYAAVVAAYGLVVLVLAALTIYRLWKAFS